MSRLLYLFHTEIVKSEDMAIDALVVVLGAMKEANELSCTCDYKSTKKEHVPKQ